MPLQQLFFKIICCFLITTTLVQAGLVQAGLVQAGLVQAGPTSAGKITVDQIRVWHSPERTRIVFDVTSNIQHQIFTLVDPDRLVVDLANANFAGEIPTIKDENSPIKAIRLGVANHGASDKESIRFVFDLKTMHSYSSFVLSPNELYGHRLVVDLERGDAMADLMQQLKSETTNGTPLTAVSSTAIDVNKPQVKAASQIKETLVTNLVASDRPARPFTIAIDAGHGGEDPGAIGYKKRSYEKNITLQIAKRLQKVINSDPRMASFLVREGDYYIKLHKRRQIARAQEADIFISIHADAFAKQSASGFSVFALSQRGATSAMARTLAAKENASDLIGGVSLKDKDELLAKVLVDLSMTNTISESVNFGARLLSHLGKLGKLHSKRVEQAGFAVLKSADIPSVLIETGFITNPGEEKKLRSSSYQERIAKAIYQAISEYYQKTPFNNNASYAKVRPATTKQGSGSNNVYHKVVRGDSLSKIALRYGTKVSTIKKQNKLRKDTVYLGQRLLVNSNKKQAAQKLVVHRVVSGDSLSKLSAKYNVTIKSIKRANGLRSDTLSIGKKLTIPGVYQKPKPTFVTHKVRRGDTLSEIAQKYNTNIRAIIQANNLRNNTVMLGQRLKVPQ